MRPPRRHPVERLESFSASLFVACGVPRQDAELTSRTLVAADLRGRTGHGLRRLRPWIERLRAGGVNPIPEIRVLHETNVSALVDGDNGLGPVVATRAAGLAIDKAEAHGLAWVGTRHSNHAGAGGIYPAMALKHRLIGLYAAVGAFNSMPPWGGREPMLGTNPLAVGIPAGTQPDFQLDIATTTTSRGTIRVHAERGEPLPVGWMTDPSGHPITDPARASEGFLTPVGGHKGSGLSMMIGFLAGVMNAAAFGTDVAAPGDPVGLPTNTGQTILVARPGLFRPADEFLAEMDRHILQLRTSQPAGEEPVRVPGERAAEMEAEQCRLGVEIPEILQATLDDLAYSLNVDPLG